MYVVCIYSEKEAEVTALPEQLQSQKTLRRKRRFTRARYQRT
jgi:hypothetical protein